MAADFGVTGEVSLSSEKAEAAFDRVGAKAGQMASKVQAEATKAGAAVDNIGTGAEAGAEKFTRAESRMRTAIQKSTRELEMLGKTASQKFEAQLDFKGLDKAKFQPFLDELRKAEEATKKAESGLSGLGSAAQAAGRAMAVAFSGAAAFGVVGKLVEVQREFDVLNSSLKTVTGSSAAAERELSWLKTFAKETPFGLAQSTQGFIKMKALGLDPTRAALTSFGNTASAMGKDLNQMIEAVADASTGEFERLKEFGIKAKKEGDNVSLTFQGVTTTIKNSAEEITKYLENIGNAQFGGAMAERAKTLDGAISELGDTWDELFRTINERNAGTLIYDSVKLANGAIEDATTIIKAMTAAYDDSGRATGALTTFQEGVATVFETVAVLGANLKYVITQVGIEIGGLAAQVAQAAQFNFSGVAAIREQMVADAEEARKQIDLTEKRILGARKAQEEYARYATRNASAATDPRRIDLAKPASSQSSSDTAKKVKEELSEYEKLMQRLGVDLPKAAAAAEAAQHGYNKSQEEFIALAGNPVWAKFTADQRKNVALKYEEKILNEQAEDAAKTLAKANIEASQAREKYLTSLASGLDKIKADTAAQLEATARMGLSKEAIAELDAAKLEMLATDLELQAIKAMDRNLDEQTYNALKQQAEAYRELAAAKKAGAAKEMELDLVKANQDAAKKAADEWQRAADDINRSLTDALLRGFESGKGFAENLRDTLKNMFGTLVLRPIISAAISPVAGAINGALYGSVGGSAGGGNALGMLGSGANLINGLQGTQGVLGTVGGWLGLNTAAANAGLASTIGIDAASAAAAANGAAAAGGGVLSGIGTALPWVAGAAALFSIIKGLDDSGTYHTGGAARYNADMGLSSGQSGADYNIGFGRVEAGAQTIGAVGTLAQSLGMALNGIAVSFGQTAGYEIATAFADDTSEDGAWGALRISRDGKDLLNWDDNRMSKWAPKEFGDGEAGYKEYLAAVAKDTRQILLDMDLPSWADKMLTSIGESASMEQLTSVIQQIGVVQTAFVGLGKSMEMFADLTDEMQSGLLAAAGSIDALTAGAGAFYQGFYSEQERIDAVVAQINTALADLDLSIDPTLGDDAKDQFRAAVEAAFAAGDAELAASLLAISGNFASAADYFEQLSNSAAQAAEQAAEQASNAARDGALRNLQNAIARDRDLLQSQAAMLEETISGISSAVDMLRSNAADLYGTVESTAQALAARGMVYVEQALAGVQAGASVTDYTGLSDAISAARSGISGGTYANETARQFDALVLAGQLTQLGDLGDMQLTTEERQLQAINDQLDYLDSLNERAQAMVDGTAALTESVDTYFQRLLKLLEPAEVADTGTLKPLQVGDSAFSSGLSGGGSSGGYSAVSEIKDFYNQTLDPDALRLQMWLRGWSIEDMAKAADVSVDFARQYLNLPQFAVGTNYVPKDMVAQIHEGEAIVPKAYNPWASGGSMGGDNTALIAEIRALREEVAELRASSAATADAAGATADVLVRVTQNGNGMVTAAAPI